jgi:glucose/mannose transport system permease protein
MPRLLSIFYRIIVHTLLVFLAILFLIPIYLLVVSSLQDASAIDVGAAWAFPTSPYWRNFVDIARQIGPRFRYSLFVAVGATLLASILGSLNGYVLSKWRLPAQKIVFPLILFAMFIPYQAVLLPLIEFMATIGLYGGLSGLILIHTIYNIPITTLIFRNFYGEIPNELLEAGLMDGADILSLYQYVIFPLSLPAFVVVIVWQFTQVWNEFLLSLTMTSPTRQPVTVWLAQLTEGGTVQWSQPMAGAIIATLPPFIVYVVMGRYFVRGLLAGSLK